MSVGTKWLNLTDPQVKSGDLLCHGVRLWREHCMEYFLQSQLKVKPFKSDRTIITKQEVELAL